MPLVGGRIDVDVWEDMVHCHANLYAELLGRIGQLDNNI